MTRIRRANNVGMHTFSGSKRPYGKCPHCKKLKPMHWISRTDFLCYLCLKKLGHNPTFQN